jgi:hypothetical protein
MPLVGACPILIVLFFQVGGESMAARANTLEVEDLQSFQRKEWRLQRVGWLVWTIVVAAALVGLLGSGPLSSTSSSAPDDSLTVRYDRFLHYHKPLMFEVTLRPGNQTNNAARLFLSDELLMRLQISRIEPEPEGRELAAGGVIYTFPSESGLETATIRVHAQYEAFGRATGKIGLVGREPATVTQFVYP